MDYKEYAEKLQAKLSAIQEIMDRAANYRPLLEQWTFHIEADDMAALWRLSRRLPPPLVIERPLSRQDVDEMIAKAIAEYDHRYIGCLRLR